MLSKQVRSLNCNTKMCLLRDNISNFRKINLVYLNKTKNKYLNFRKYEDKLTCASTSKFEIQDVVSLLLTKFCF